MLNGLKLLIAGRAASTAVLLAVLAACALVDYWPPMETPANGSVPTGLGT
jgi:hypothetical protein